MWNPPDAANIADQKIDAYEVMDRVPEDQALRLLAELAIDEQRFVRCWREAPDSYVCVCNYCGASHNDEYQITHKPTCPVARARALLDTHSPNWRKRLQLEVTIEAYL